MILHLYTPLPYTRAIPAGQSKLSWEEKLQILLQEVSCSPEGSEGCAFASVHEDTGVLCIDVHMLGCSRQSEIPLDDASDGLDGCSIPCGDYRFLQLRDLGQHGDPGSLPHTIKRELAGIVQDLVDRQGVCRVFIRVLCEEAGQTAVQLIVPTDTTTGLQTEPIGR